MPPTEARRFGPRRAGLAATVTVAAVFRLWHVNRNGFGNPYYAAAVHSMSRSWHNFFYASLDPRGFVSIDKPPLGLWVQTLAVKLFGFHPLSLLMPSVIAGILAVAVVYLTVERWFGPRAATLAAGVLAVTPISVAADRFNDQNALLALWLALTAWAVLRAVDRGGLRWLLVGAVCVGFGFETKSLAGLLALPAFWVTYLVCGTARLRTRVVHLLAATAVVVAVSGAWMAAVDLTPASARPYVGGSTNNSELDLTFGYNGLGRLAGTAGPPSADVPAVLHLTTAQLRWGDAGLPSPLRLFDVPPAGQWSWPVPIAVAGMAAGVVELGRRRRRDPRMAAWLMWGAWLATEVVVFSSARGLFHSHYLTAMMPAVAGMTGAGVEALRRAWRRGSHAALLVPTAVAVTGLLELHILSDLSVHWAEATYGRLGPLICAVALVAALLLVAARIDVAYRRMARTAAVAALAIGCLGPAAWTSSVLRDAGALNTPVAGPPLDRYAAIRTAEERAARQIGLPASAVDTVSSPGGAETASLIAFASANLHGERWALATEVGIQSSDIMIRSDLAVAALGGIQGDDPIVSSSALAKMVAAHEVRFVLLKQPPAPGPTVRDDAAWVEAHCVTVPASLWQPPAGFGVRPGDTLQDCSPGTAPVMASSAAFPA